MTADGNGVAGWIQEGWASAAWAQLTPKAFLRIQRPLSIVGFEMTDRKRCLVLGIDENDDPQPDDRAQQVCLNITQWLIPFI